jgi:hypothetical protein
MHARRSAVSTRVGYAETVQRVAALDRLIVERTAVARTGTGLGEPDFSSVLSARIALGQASGTPAPGGPAVNSLLAPAGALPATALGAMYPAPMTTAPPPTAPSMLRGKIDGLEPELLAGLEQVARAIGKPIEIISGLRTREEQEELYRRYLNGTGNLAAVPGTSRHESGQAADVYVDGVPLANVEGARQAASDAGLGFPVAGEAWHVERT